MADNSLVITFSLDSNSTYYLDYSLFQFAGLNLNSSYGSILSIYEGDNFIEGTLEPGTYSFGVYATENGDLT